MVYLPTAGRGTQFITPYSHNLEGSFSAVLYGGQWEGGRDRQRSFDTRRRTTREWSVSLAASVRHFQLSLCQAGDKNSPKTLATAENYRAEKISLYVVARMLQAS